MSKIKNMLIKEAANWVEFPGIPGFFVEINFMPKEELLKIRKASLSFVFNRRTHQREEEVDSAKFLSLYAEKAISNWRGLKIKHLSQLLPVDTSYMNLEEEVPYSVEDAEDLLKNSPVFDQFITDSINDFEQFSKKNREADVKN